MHSMPATPGYLIDDLDYEAAARRAEEARAELERIGIPDSAQELLDEANRVLDPYGYDPVRSLRDLEGWL